VPLALDTFSPPIFDAIVEASVAAVVEARASLVPASMGAASTTVTGVGENRRLTCKAEGDPPNTEPDSEVGVLRVDRADGAPLATVLNHGVHGVSLPASNLAFSPDNGGYAERWVETHAGGMAFFLNGTEGDVNPPEGVAPEVIGERLGRAVTDVWPGIETTDAVRLSWSYCRIDDPGTYPSYARPCPGSFAAGQIRMLMAQPDPEREGCFVDRGEPEHDDALLNFRFEKGPDLEWIEREGVHFGAFGLTVGEGDAATRIGIATIPGEPITDIGLEIKGAATESLGVDHAWVVSLANSHIGYVVTEREYFEGGYESALNAFGPTTGAVTVRNAMAVLGEAAKPR